jgi:PilZ domain-containing protein
MPETSFAVRRANPRFAFVAEAEMVKLRDGLRIVGRIAELSSRGCYVDTVDPVPIGTPLRLRIRYGCSTCEVTGKTIYTHSGWGMGVLFGDVAPPQKTTIETWLSELARKSA